MTATARAASNIAFLKYWGKKDPVQNIPLNPSISLTLDEAVSTLTTVEFGLDIKQDTFILNGQEEQGEKLRRVSGFLDLLRNRAGTMAKAIVMSRNSFPTGTGMASSASGFAALAGAASKALDLPTDDRSLAAWARLGSGSACRSVMGGIIEWDGSEVTQLHDHEYWDHLRDLIVIVSAGEKPLGSREAMQRTVETSSRFKERLKQMPERQAAFKEAIKARDFQRLAPLIMQDSDELHACIRDTKPPITYLNDASKRIIDAIRKLNNSEYLAAYTFDAGPNAHIICDAHDLGKVQEAIKGRGIEGLSYIVAGPGPGLRFSQNHLM